jgi:hypothetical protein
MTPEDILLTFQSAVTTQASNDGSDSSDVFNVCFPVTVQVGEGATQTPFFFGIDCRSEAERRLGQFPKAFVMDPSSVTDPEQIAALLQVVEPMAASAHLCIIGSGDDYLRWQYKQANSKRRKKNSAGDSPELLASIVEQNSSLSAVAMFFLKKSFSRVRSDVFLLPNISLSCVFISQHLGWRLCGRSSLPAQSGLQSQFDGRAD